MLDIYTLIIYDIIVLFTTGVILFFYKLSQKTYNGFGYWILGSIIIGIGYFVLISRQTFLPTWLSILIVNFLFPFAAILRLDGTLRFTKETSLQKSFYLLPIIQVFISIYFTFIKDEIIIRNFTQTVIISFTAILIAILLFKSSKTHKTAILYIAGIINILFTITLITRALLWISNPKFGLFESNSTQLVHFLLISIYEIGWCVSFIMLNSQRLEEDLIISNENLQKSVIELETALSEIKTLEGLVPICSNCKSIRDDKGYWNKLEAFLMEHSDAQFSHGICPDCAKKLYPEFYNNSENE